MKVLYDFFQSHVTVKMYKLNAFPRNHHANENNYRYVIYLYVNIVVKNLN